MEERSEVRSNNFINKSKRIKKHKGLEANRKSDYVVVENLLEKEV